MAANPGSAMEASDAELPRKRRGIPPFRRRRANVEWTEPMLSLLGTDIDRNIAAELGVHHASVTYRRSLLGIPPFGPGRFPRSRVIWSRHALALLGTAPDGRVARRLRLTKMIVWRKRHELGIPSFAPPSPRIVWTAERLAMLGRRRDTVIAREMGIRPATVLRKRQQLGLSPYRVHAPIVRTRRLKALLGLPSKEIHEKHHLSSGVIAKLRREYGRPAPGTDPGRWTAAILRRLGREPDTAIARELGIKPSSVVAKRRTLGIGRFDARHRWSQAECRMVGHMPDTELARRLGVSINVVRLERRRLGRARYRDVPPLLRSLRRLKALLRRVPNRELHRRHGLSLDRISDLRRKFGIPAPGRPPRGRWTKAVIARLGRVPDAEIARDLGIHISSARAKRVSLGIERWSQRRHWTRAECRLLGRLPDRQIARKLGLSAEAVGEKRRSLRIPCAPPTERPSR